MQPSIGHATLSLRLLGLLPARPLKHTRIIARGLSTFVEVGRALLTIRERRLYEEAYTTFDEYLHERWGIARNYGNRRIAASNVYCTLLSVPIGSKHYPSLPTAESQRGTASYLNYRHCLVYAQQVS